ncbi:MAG: type I polyketide synthase, partial [Longimicrobiales bacterium]
MSDDDRLETAIAIVGMAGHFPGARNPAELWELLAEGRECLTDFSDEELKAAGVRDQMLENPAYVRRAPILDEMEWFDAGFFGLSPRDAAIMDPQHRHFLECCWEALEDAGHVASRFEGSIGVFAGSGTNSYFWRNVMSNPDLVEEVGFFLLRHTGNDKDFLSTRVSYALDLKGPSVNVQTACSTSLVAVHYAAQSLLAGECDMALAGGSTIEQPHRVGYVYQEGEILSPDGHCRPFDADSAGTLFGSGSGAVLLKRYADAVEDGNHIYALVVGSAVNNDGAGKVGYLAPGVEGQAQAIQEALSIAEVNPETVSYVEAHGTGTRIGDPIEVAALTQAYRTSTTRTGFCGLGSIKSNMGHLDTAAGIAGLMKVALSMEHELLPATLNFSAPNPNLDWESSPFYVVSDARPWPRTPSIPRRAGVGSLGVGGTNAHLVLEEAPQLAAPARVDDGRWRIVPLSARSRPALERGGARLAEHVEQFPGLHLGDVAHTLSVGRHAFSHRRAVIARSGEDIVNALGTRKSDYAVAGEAAQDLECVFMFAGGGAQYPGMARGLYDSEPVFKAALEECLGIAGTHTDRDLFALLYPEAAEYAAAASELKRPSRALPILFSVQYSMAKLLGSWGVEPAAMIGHSMGEYTAACLSGVLTLEGALRIVSLRGRLFEELGPGGMISVSASEEAILEHIPQELSVAAVNAPEMCVVAGPVEPLATFEAHLVGEGFETRRVHIDVAAHSKMLDPILDPFLEGIQDVEFGVPKIPFVSNLSGQWIGEEASTPEYWVRHLRESVRFSDGLGRIAQD